MNAAQQHISETGHAVIRFEFQYLCLACNWEADVDD